MALSALADATATVAGSLNVLADGLESSLGETDIADSLTQLTSALQQLDAGYTLFEAGLGSYLKGVNDLSSGYGDFHGGLLELNGGFKDFGQGIKDLHEGTDLLKDETSSMPDKIQEEIDNLLDEYTGENKDYKPVSFTSEKNMEPDLLQFVIRIEGVEKPEEPVTVEIVQKEVTLWQTIWKRIVSLFGS